MRTRLCHGRYGDVIYPADDIWIGRSFALYGEYSELETDVFKRLVKPGDTVIDAGANIGAHTLLLSKLVGDTGSVVAFEPQRSVYYCLCGNLALNSISNVTALEVALGAEDSQATLSVYDAETGRTHIGEHEESSSSATVQIMTIDGFNLNRVDFIKGDVEGFEGQMVLGAKETIARDRPIMYLETSHAGTALVDQMRALGYDLWHHRPRMFNPDNFNHNPADTFLLPVDDQINTFGVIVSENMLCVPSERGFASTIAGWDTADRYERIPARNG